MKPIEKNTNLLYSENFVLRGVVTEVRFTTAVFVAVVAGVELRFLLLSEDEEDKLLFREVCCSVCGRFLLSGFVSLLWSTDVPESMLLELKFRGRVAVFEFFACSADKTRSDINLQQFKQFNTVVKRLSLPQGLFSLWAISYKRLSADEVSIQ